MSIQSDLRPISLTATLGKILESFIGTWILERVGKTLDRRQYGALKKRSTTHALVDIMRHWHSAVDAGQSVRIVFIDFAKAFDRVDHNVLMSWLVDLDQPDIIVRWMHSYLLDRRRKCAVRLAATDCWYATRVLSWAASVCHNDSLTSAALPYPQVY